MGNGFKLQRALSKLSGVHGPKTVLLLDVLHVLAKEADGIDHVLRVWHELQRVAKVYKIPWLLVVGPSGFHDLLEHSVSWSFKKLVPLNLVPI